MLIQASFCCGVSTQTAERNRATVTIDTPSIVREFDPNEALGAGIDGHGLGEINELLSPANVEQMLSAGFKPITYRLRTELANEAWHWNPNGAWSDVSGAQGYWTSDVNSDGDISLSYGYSLPRRGNTIDQAINKGYSRIDDGDPDSYWKSNPYLDEAFTKDDNAFHQQWVVIDLGSEKEVNAVRIQWGSPYAAEYEIQYGSVSDISDIAQNPPGLWHTFVNGRVSTKAGGDMLTRVSQRTIRTRYLRILLKKSSFMSAADSSDIRDKLGFAIREIYVGTVKAAGHFTDEIRHGKQTNGQSAIFVSSTDPWHRSTDNDFNTEHAGFDRLYNSGLTNDSPVLIPVGVLYDTPENAAAEISYLIKKGYRIAGVEVGEEPDGQYVTPEDYGALYIQWAEAIHKIAPQIKIGGPSFQEIAPDTRRGKTEGGNPVWFERFIKYLERRRRTSDFSFLSFEWYPFDEVCGSTAPQIASEAELLRRFLAVFRKHGLKADVPLVMTEYGYSAFSTQAEDDIEGALFNADTIGTFLTIGGGQAYLYGYEPNVVERDFPCTAGNNMLFLHDGDGKIEYRTATYFGSRMMMTEWLQPSGGVHSMYRCDTAPIDPKGKAMIAAYAVQRPDKQWSIMLLNKDPQRAWTANVSFSNSSGPGDVGLAGEVDLYQFSAEQYKWDANVGLSAKSDPPKHTRLDAAAARNLQLPPYSLTVLRGSVK